MRKLIFLAIVVLLPTSICFARTPASFSAAESVFATSSIAGNAYALGATIVSTASIQGDFSAFGGSIITAAPIGGDAVLGAGSIRIRTTIDGDVRAAGGTITIDEPIGGDLVAFGYALTDEGRIGGDVFIAGVNTTVARGAAGSVTIYANNVSIGGTIGGDVRIVAGGRVALSPDTVIHGKLSYEAPEHAIIPPQAVIEGGVNYTSASYLPNIGTSRIIDLINMGFFLLVRILGALLLVGLIAGLFPRFAYRVVERAYSGRVRNWLLTLLLGFAIVVATPILIVLLLLTFVGIGLALLLLFLYALVVGLGLLYAGILLGSVLARRYEHRDRIIWRDGVIGMLILSFITLIPFVGTPLMFLLATYEVGVLLQIFFAFAFPHEDHTAALM